ncbi:MULTISPECIES: anti-sigma factor [Microbacterium]|uniref:anti-sigma factor n=1 Tax=Microbacterium TaxID=33882 RepID=UPI00146B7F00|nr:MULTISPECIES: anti-sigma factor [Microbacterium]
MSHLDPERLALVAIGEPVAPDEEHHLETCDVCTLDLAELEHTVAVGKSTVSLGDLEAPPERVWDRILHEVRGGGEAVAELAPDDAADSATRTPAATAPVAAGTQTDASSRRRPRPLLRTLLTLAAGMAVIFVGFGAWNLLRPPESIEIASATLAAFPEHPGAEGQAFVTEDPDGERTVTVRLDASEEGDGFREVWLITADATAIVSLGELEGDEGTFVVPDDVDLRDYVLVDISQEPLDGDPTHSGDSIVRGELGFS